MFNFKHTFVLMPEINTRQQEQIMQHIILYNVCLSNRLISARNVNETQTVYEDTNNPHPIHIKHATSYLCSTFYYRLKSVRYVNEIENVCANIRIL